MPSRGNPVIRIRLAPDARACWQSAADDSALSLSEWVRQAVEAALARHRLRARRAQIGR